MTSTTAATHAKARIAVAARDAPRGSDCSRSLTFHAFRGGWTASGRPRVTPSGDNTAVGRQRASGWTRRGGLAVLAALLAAALAWWLMGRETQPAALPDAGLFGQAQS